METRPTLQVRVTVVEGFAAGRTFDVLRFPAVLGRGDDADLPLPDHPSEPTLSRRHLRLSVASGRLQVEDLSTNGTVRGGKLLPAGHTVVLDDADELVLGQGTRLRLEIVRSAAAPPPEPAPESALPVRPLALRTLGAFEASVDGRVIPAEAWDTRKPMLLLAYLAEGRPVAPERACDDLWPDVAGARQALQSTLSRLRRTFRRVEAPDPVLFEGGLYRLHPVPWCDSVELARGESLAGLRRLYQGEFLPGFTEDWVVHRRAALTRLYFDGMARLAERLPASEAVALYLELLQSDPLWEAGHRGLLALYRGQGQRDEGVRHYHRYVAALKKGLDLGPSPEMLELYQQLIG